MQTIHAFWPLFVISDYHKEKGRVQLIRQLSLELIDPDPERFRIAEDTQNKTIFLVPWNFLRRNKKRGYLKKLPAGALECACGPGAAKGSGKCSASASLRIHTFESHKQCSTFSHNRFPLSFI